MRVCVCALPLLICSGTPFGVQGILLAACAWGYLADYKGCGVCAETQRWRAKKAEVALQRESQAPAGVSLRCVPAQKVGQRTQVRISAWARTASIFVSMPYTQAALRRILKCNFVGMPHVQAASRRILKNNYAEGWDPEVQAGYINCEGWFDPDPAHGPQGPHQVRRQHVCECARGNVYGVLLAIYRAHLDVVRCSPAAARVVLARNRVCMCLHVCVCMCVQMPIEERCR